MAGQKCGRIPQEECNPDRSRRQESQIVKRSGEEGFEMRSQVCATGAQVMMCSQEHSI